MSGGMRQRIVGAIAQAGGPQVIIADEPTTNLDVTIQLQYLNLLKDLQRASGVALIFVTHNLGIVAKMCDRVAVMYAGQDRRAAVGARSLLHAPASVHAGAARLDPEARDEGAALRDPRPAAGPAALPAGCSFHPRCAQAMDRCRTEEPPDHAVGDGTTSRCWLAIEWGRAPQAPALRGPAKPRRSRVPGRRATEVARG